jgi:hypothetical protein
VSKRSKDYAASAMFGMYRKECQNAVKKKSIENFRWALIWVLCFDGVLTLSASYWAWLHIGKRNGVLEQ